MHWFQYKILILLYNKSNKTLLYNEYPLLILLSCSLCLPRLLYEQYTIYQVPHPIKCYPTVDY